MTEAVGAGKHTKQAVADTSASAADFAQLVSGSQTTILRQSKS